MPRVTFTVEGGIGWLVLNRPERRNALDGDMVRALHGYAEQIAARDDVGVVILTGEGGAFCAGGDIDAWGALSPADFARSWIRVGHAAFDALARLPQPLIAVLNGPVLGGGLELAACADMRITEAHVTFGQPESGLGIIPGWSGTQRVVRRFGVGVVRRMALFGEVISAEEAVRLNIADQLVATGEGRAAAETWARMVLSRAPEATELTKLLLNAAEGEEIERPLDMLAGWAAAGTPSLAEGLAAFRGKRKPSFRK